jgi:DAACS family dicarboxylate/amino acid:cation (Na+ or H+) symporter
MANMASEGKGVSLHTKILLALVLGAVAGSTANVLTHRWPQEVLLPLMIAPEAGLPGALPWSGLLQQFQPPPPTWSDLLIQYVMNPIGQIFLRLLFLTVVPLVFASLALGVAQLGSRGNLGRIGLKTFSYFIATMTTAVIIGLLLVNLVQPGRGLPQDTSERLLRIYGSEAASRTGRPTDFGIDTFVNIVPRNPLAAMVEMDMLAIIFVALLVGMGLTLIERTRAQAIIQVLEGINDLMVVIIDWAMHLAPYGVFALIYTVTARFGFDLLRPLGLYVVVVLVGLAIQMFGVLSVLLVTLARVNPFDFFRRVRDVLITAFSTSSSNATLPTSIKIAEEELGVPSSIAGFVLPLGATMNMNGTALFEGVTVVFLAQVFGVQLTLLDQIIVVILAVMTAIGAAGVPGGSMPLLVMVLATVHVPEMGIALILGVDRLLDMSRTTLNVIGDISAATVVARSEGFAIMPAKKSAASG